MIIYYIYIYITGIAQGEFSLGIARQTSIQNSPDIHKSLECNYALFEEVHGNQILFVKFCFQDDFKGIKSNECQEFQLIVMIV